jgi:hypothetical protein
MNTVYNNVVQMYGTGDEKNYTSILRAARVVHVLRQETIDSHGLPLPPGRSGGQSFNILIYKLTALYTRMVAHGLPPPDAK